MKSILLFFAIVGAASAQIFTSGATLTSPFTGSILGVTATGGLVLDGAGDNLTYNASFWTVTGGLRLARAANYTITASSFTLTGGIAGPASGTAYIKIDALFPVITGTVAANVRILAANEPFPAPPSPPSPPPGTPTIPLPAPGSGAAPLVNISTRAVLAAGGALTPGFVVGGTTSRRVLVRAVGPGLAAFGVSGPISAPVLAIYRGSEEIARNAGWAADLAPIFGAVGAFALTPGSRDAALLLTLAPGAYTARIDGGAGEVLAEVYFVD